MGIITRYICIIMFIIMLRNKIKNKAIVQDNENFYSFKWEQSQSASKLLKEIRLYRTLDDFFIFKKQLGIR